MVSNIPDFQGLSYVRRWESPACRVAGVQIRRVIKRGLMVFSGFQLKGKVVFRDIRSRCVATRNPRIIGMNSSNHALGFQAMAINVIVVQPLKVSG